MAQPDYFSNDAIRDGLKGKTVRGGIALGAAQAAIVVLQLACIPILSRLLSPEDFGLVAMATVFTGFGALLIDSGFASASVQQDELTREQSSNFFWIASVGSAGLMLLTLAVAWPIGWAVGQTEVAAVIAALATTYALTGLSIQHQALLRRSLRFSTLSMIRVAAVCASLGVSIGLAYAWRSHWALVAGQVSQSIVTLAITWSVCRWRPGRPTRGVGTRSMVEFGASLTAARFVNYATRTADRLIVGSMLGPAALGYYERAYKSLLYPIHSVDGPLVSLMTPALSRLVSRPDLYRRAYFTAARGLATLGFPCVAYAAIDADRLVRFVLGEEWGPAVPIFLALTPAAAVGVLKSTSSWAYISLGRGVDQLKWHSLAGAVTLTGVAIGSAWGAAGTAWGFSAASVLLFPIGIRLAYADSPLTVGSLAVALRPVLICTAIAAVATLGAQRSAPGTFNVEALGSLLASAAVMIAVYVSGAALAGLHRALEVPTAPGPTDAPDDEAPVV